MKEWICQEEPLIRADGASVGVGFRQMVELVRCKDCKHWYFTDNRIPSEQENVCGRNGIVVMPDWFCADGERKDDG